MKLKVSKVNEQVKGFFTKTILNKNIIKLRTIIESVVMIVITVVMLVAYSRTQLTVDVCIANNEIYRNAIITENQLKKYPMKKNEYSQYAERNKNGVIVTRLVKWEDRKDIIGTYCAYPMHTDSLIERKSLTNSIVDNSKSVLYTNPGKNIRQLNISTADLSSFKTVLQPGDKINIRAKYKDSLSMTVSGRANQNNNMNVETIRTKDLFPGLVIADILNAEGNSVLDYYSTFNNLTKEQQQKLEKTEAFAKATKCQTIWCALTPEEEDLFDIYTSMADVELIISLPQRYE